MVRIDPLFTAPAPARVGGAAVTFEPGARTAWHTRPLGQTLIVTAGVGWAQREGGPVEEIRPGDVVWFPPGEKHWHGGTATTAMAHIAVQEALDGKAVECTSQMNSMALDERVVTQPTVTFVRKGCLECQFGGSGRSSARTLLSAGGKP